MTIVKDFTFCKAPVIKQNYLLKSMKVFYIIFFLMFDIHFLQQSGRNIFSRKKIASDDAKKKKENLSIYLLSA